MIKTLYKNNDITITADFREVMTANDLAMCVDAAIGAFMSIDHSERYHTELKDAVLLGAVLRVMSDYESDALIDDCVRFLNQEYVVNDILVTLYGDNWEAIEHAYDDYIESLVHKSASDGFFVALNKLCDELNKQIFTEENVKRINELLEMVGDLNGIR